MGDHAMPRFLVRQREHCIAGPPRLERARLLQVLALEVQLASQRGVDARIAHHRAPHHVGGGNPLTRGVDFGKSKHG